MKPLKKFALGFWVYPDVDFTMEVLKMYDTNFGDRLHDIHFSHYENSLIASGRNLSGIKEKKMFEFLERALSETDLRLTLLMNYLIKKDYSQILNIFDKYYKAGIRSVVIADLELIKRIKQKYPDVFIQGSCLSYRNTEEELYEEAKEGVELHNPSVDIIRMPGQIEKNFKAGFKQKILFAEGCYHKCPFEKPKEGHRWKIARNEPFYHKDMCERKIFRDARDFFLANWVTIHQLKKIEDYIDVVKLPRGQMTDPYKSTQKIRSTNNLVRNMDESLASFIHKYDNNIPHDVLDFNTVAYKYMLRANIGYVNSAIFDDFFFERTSSCEKRCRELRCTLCDEKLKQIINSQPNGRVVGSPKFIKIMR